MGTARAERLRIGKVSCSCLRLDEDYPAEHQLHGPEPVEALIHPALADRAQRKVLNRGPEAGEDHFQDLPGMAVGVGDIRGREGVLRPRRIERVDARVEMEAEAVIAGVGGF